MQMTRRHRSIEVVDLPRRLRLSARYRQDIDQQRATLRAAKPVVLKGQTGQGKQSDVVVLHHVLRVVQVSGTEQQGQHSGDRLRHVEAKHQQKPVADQHRQYAD